MMSFKSVQLSRYICNLQYNIRKDNPEEDCCRYIIDSKIIDSIKNDKLLSLPIYKLSDVLVSEYS
jgi:hypothetical protein